MTQSLEDKISSAQPHPWLESDEIDDSARRLALAVSQENATAWRSRHRVKFAVLLAGALVVGSATTAAAVPAIVAWAPWEPDATVQRSFTLDTGQSASCTMVMKVLPDLATATDDLDRNVKDARVFLRDHDWSAILRLGSRQAKEALRLSAAAAETQSKFDEAQGAAATSASPAPSPKAPLSESTSIAADVSTRVQEVFQSAGVLKAGVSVESQIECTDGASE